MAKPSPEFITPEYTYILYDTAWQFPADPRADIFTDTPLEVWTLEIKNKGSKGRCLFQVWEGGKGKVLQSKEKELDTSGTITDGDLPAFTLPPGDYAVGDDLDMTLYAYYWDPDEGGWVQNDSYG